MNLKMKNCNHSVACGEANLRELIQRPPATMTAYECSLNVERMMI